MRAFASVQVPLVLSAAMMRMRMTMTMLMTMLMMMMMMMMMLTDLAECAFGDGLRFFGFCDFSSEALSLRLQCANLRTG